LKQNIKEFQNNQEKNQIAIVLKKKQKMNTQLNKDFQEFGIVEKKDGF
jgi:hypothetical protein